MRSLRTRLTVLTLSVIAIVFVPFCLLSYSKIVEEVDELSDARLAQSARTLNALASNVALSPSAADGALEIAGWNNRKRDHSNGEREEPTETEIGFQYWSAAGVLLVSTADLHGLARAPESAGYADIVWQSQRWRIFALTLPSGVVVKAAERYDSRDEITHQLFLQNTAPLAIVIPLLALLVSWAVARGLRPLSSAADRLGAREKGDLTPVLVVDSPHEIEPLIGAINSTLSVARQALESERNFTSNAAHELRTPLAGLMVQLANAEAASDAVARGEALREAHVSAERMTRVVKQMLDLARWDAESDLRHFERVDIERCVAEELATISATIIKRDIEVGRRFPPAGLHCQGWEPGIRTIIRNLIENASLYCFEGGRVDIEGYVVNGCATLAVADNGPGILPADRDAMLRRFGRGEHVYASGSGLGLSIVAKVVEIHAARLTMTDSKQGGGLRVEVQFGG